MDKIITHKHKKLRRWIAGTGVILVPIMLIAWALGENAKSVVKVNDRELSTAIVQRMPFEEMITADGFILPHQTVVIDAVIGGKLVKKHAEDGAKLQKGDTILELENMDLKLDILNRETAVMDMMTNIQHTRNLLDQTIVNRQSELADVQFQLTEAKREHQLNEDLAQHNVIAPQEFLKSLNTLQYLEKREALIRKAVVRDSLVGRSQIRQMEASLSQARKNLELMKQKLLDLIVTAPIDGQLSSFNLEIGTLITAGENIAQIDRLDAFKMRVRVDQQHSHKITVEQSAWTEINGERFAAGVQKIYPTVSNNQFDVDLEFTIEQPGQLKRGQNITAKITLSQPRESLVVKKGSFFQSTGGQWIFVINRDKREAFRRSIKLGKHNPEYYEVTEGLEEGEEVIISAYHQFESYQQLELQP